MNHSFDRSDNFIYWRILNSFFIISFVNITVYCKIILKHILTIKTIFKAKWILGNDRKMLDPALKKKHADLPLCP